MKTTTDGTKNEVATYGYDALNRLTSESIFGGPQGGQSASYTYD